MEKTFRVRSKNGAIFNAIIFIILFAATIFICVQFCYMNVEQKKIEKRLCELEKNLQNNISFNEVEYNKSLEITDDVSLSLGIISAGISVFAIFGGILSVLNILRAKELEDAMNTTAQMKESQQELASARLVQEGRVYAMRSRNKYAVDCFERAITCAPESTSALIAEYELLSLYADVLPGSRENMEELRRKVQCLVEKLNKHKTLEKQLLKADAYFLLGCVCGSYSLNQKCERDKLLKESECYFNKAIECDKGNVDFYRNLALTYALANEKEKCKIKLQFAIDISKQEVLYAGMVDNKRLERLFKPSWAYLTREVKNMLNKSFKIQCH